MVTPTASTELADPTGTKPPLVGELVSVPTDTVALDGLWLQAPRASGATAMLMHGNGANFYSGPVRFLLPSLLGAGITCFTYNRRGHETLTTRTRQPEGNAYQTAAQAIADNAAARAFVAQRGEPQPIVVGHSNGGLYAARHVADHGARALVLLSAHCGGPEMVVRASALGLMAQDRQAELSAQAQALVDAGRPDDLLLMPGWWYVTSARSFLDMERNVPRLLQAAAQIDCPVLAIRGSLEDADLYPAEQLPALARGRVDVHVVPGADHFYTGHEDEVATVVTDWLVSVLGHRAPGGEDPCQ